jgi:rod shape-determining protein MreC
MNLNNDIYKKQTIPILIYLFASFLLVSLSIIKVFDPLYLLDDKLTSNLRSYFYAAGTNVNGSLAFFVNSSSLVQENADLKREIYQYESIQAENEQLKLENTALQNQLGVHIPTQKSPIFALITSKSPLLNAITINTGSEEGVQNNSVVVYENILIGNVISVTPESATVQLVSSDSSSIPVIIPSTNVEGVVSGSIQSGITMNEILPGQAVTTGSTVITSGLGGIYPNGLFVGTVKSVAPISSQPFKSAVIAPGIDVSSLTYVFVLKK